MYKCYWVVFMLLGHSGFEGYFSAGAGYLVIRMGCWRINASTHQRTNIWFKRRDTWLCDFGKNRWQMADGSFLGSMWMSYGLQITFSYEGKMIQWYSIQFSRERNADWQEKWVNILLIYIYIYIYIKIFCSKFLLLLRKLYSVFCITFVSHFVLKRLTFVTGKHSSFPEKVAHRKLQSVSRKESAP